MLDRLGIAVLAALVLAACEPKAPELDGAPAGDVASDTTTEAPGELAGGQSPGQQVILPGVMNIAAPFDSQVMNSCEKIIAVDYDQPPMMACVFYLRDAATPASEFDRVLDYQLATAGWTHVRTTGAQHYFEYPKPGTDCADLSVFTALDKTQLDGLLKAASAAPAPDGQVWRGYSVPATIRETCGADRMKP